MMRVHGGDISREASRLGVEPSRILDLSASLNPLGPPEGLKQHLMENFRAAVHYPEPDAASVREALANSHRLAKEQIAVANGSTEIIHLLPRTLAWKRAVVATPAFSEYEAGLASAEAVVEYFPLNPEEGFIPRAQELLSFVEDGVDVLYLANPSSPSGALVPKDTLLEIIKGCQELQVDFFLDEVFVDFTPENSLAGELSNHPNLMILRSMTKFYALAGLRIGYLLAAQETIERLLDIIPPWSVNGPAQVAGLYCIKQVEYAEQSRIFVKEEREWLFRELSLIEGLSPFESAANFILVKLEARGLTAGELRQRLLGDAILIRDCTSFHHLGTQYFRVALGRREQNLRLLEALRRALEK